MRGGFPLGLSTSVTLEDFSLRGLFPRVIDSQVPVPHFAVLTLGPESRFGVSPLLVCSPKNVLDRLAPTWRRDPTLLWSCQDPSSLSTAHLLLFGVV